MATRIAIRPERMEEAVTAVTAEQKQLSEDKTDQLRIVKGETEEAANDAGFVYGFTAVSDALVRKAENIVRGLENYSKSINTANEELTKTDDDAKRGIKESDKQIK